MWDHAAVGATAVSALHNVFGDDRQLAFALLIISAVAIGSLFLRFPWNVVFLIPQQSLLLISATGAITAMVLSQFADGVVRPRAFIEADKIDIVFVAIGHATAIVSLGFSAGARK